MAHFKIAFRWDSNKILYEGEAESLKDLVATAIRSKADLRGSDLSGSDLSGSDLSGSDLSYSDLRGSNLSGSNLSGSDLSYSDLRDSDLRGSDLSGSDLSGSDLSGSDLSYSDLRGSNLSGSNLSGSNLRYSDLRDSDLRGSNLSYSDLRGSNLSGSNLRGHKVKRAVAFAGLYAYVVIPFVTEDNERRIIMGCHNRSLAEWNVDEWNNPSEFPNDGSEKSRLRHFALETAKAWLKEFGNPAA